MNARAFFESLWSEPAAAEGDGPPLCRFATQFQTWADALLTETLKRQYVVGINQAKISLLDKYFEWRTIVPRAHRDKVSSTGHLCLWHVFEAAYNRLREAELALTPPLLYVPTQPSLPAPAAPPAKQIPGIFIAEEDS